MSSSGDCFVVLPTYSADETIILGRNFIGDTSLGDNDACEVQYYDATVAVEGNSDGGAAPEIKSETLRIILQRPRTGIWGGDYGANEKNVCIAITWSANEPDNNSGSLQSTDILRYVLATSSTAAEAVDCVGNLVENNGSEDAKMNFIVCDPTEAWIVSCGAKLWAAQRLSAFHHVSNNGLAVTTTIEKSSEGLSDALTTLGLWNGEGDLNFAEILSATSTATWTDNEPTNDGSFALVEMFETLRSAANADTCRAANVSVLTSKGVSSHWFTCTPNVNQSVFKPFVFAPNPKISPLTKVAAEKTVTLLHHLHAQRKPAAIDDLKNLETSCIGEVTKYLIEHSVTSELDELDELMKDCVEAEVKFYR